MKISVKFNDLTFAFSVSKDDQCGLILLNSLYSVGELLYRPTLLFKDKPLDARKTISHYQIEAGSTLQLRCSVAPPSIKTENVNSSSNTNTNSNGNSNINNISNISEDTEELGDVPTPTAVSLAFELYVGRACEASDTQHIRISRFEICRRRAATHCLC